MNDHSTLIIQRKSIERPDVLNAIEAVHKLRIPLRVRIPWDQSDNTVIMDEAIQSGSRRIIAGGGDGTINAVANFLVGDGTTPAKAELGILPLGTANDFARGCNLPTEDLTECLKIACTAESTPFDIGKMNGQNFINVASLGFGAEVTATTPVEMKKVLKGGAYTLMGLATAMKFKPYSGQLILPGGESIQGEMLVAAVGNNRFAGGGFEVAPDASTDDGLLDLSVIRYDESFSVATAIQELKDPTNPNNQYIIYRKLSEFAIECDRELHCNLDGEPVKTKRLNFSISPVKINVASR